MPSPNTVFTELVTTTFRKHSKDIKDNVSKNNALYRQMVSKGQTRKEDSGLSIVQGLDYANNSTYQRYSGYDVLNVGASDVLSAAEYQWRQIAINVVASGLELRTNSGGSRIVNLVKSRMKNATRTFKNNFSADLYSDGTLPNQIGGLQVIVADNGQGTVGGIDSATWAFWRNQFQSAATPLQGGGAITPSATTIESLMLPLWIKLTRGTDMPDLIVMDPIYFAFFEQSQTSLKRYAPEDDGKGGMISMKYKTADVFFDASTLIPASHAYFIDTDYLELVVHRDANMEMMDDLRSINQDAIVTPILWMGNLVVSNRSLQGVMKA